MNILDKIVTDKRKEIDLKKSIVPVSQLESSLLFGRNTYSLAEKLQTSTTGIIVNIKDVRPPREL